MKPNVVNSVALVNLEVKGYLRLDELEKKNLQLSSIDDYRVGQTKLSWCKCNS